MPQERVKHPMQNVSFRHIDELLDFLPKDELLILETLRELIFDTIPFVKEKLSFNVPYYFLKRNVCFLWPASVLWGKKKTYGGVRLGFAKGYLMSDPEGILEKGPRKQIYWVDFSNKSAVDVALIRQYLLEAVSLDTVHSPTYGARRKSDRAHFFAYPWGYLSSTICFLTAS